MLLTVLMAFAGAQTAGAQDEQTLCKITFDIRGEGTVEFDEGPVTNGQIIGCTTERGYKLIITPASMPGIVCRLTKTDKALPGDERG